MLPSAGRPKPRSFTAAQWRPVLGLAAVFATVNLTLYAAIDRTGLGLAVTPEFLGPLAVAPASSRRRTDLACALAAAAGVVVLTRPRPSTDYLRHRPGPDRRRLLGLSHPAQPHRGRAPARAAGIGPGMPVPAPTGPSATSSATSLAEAGASTGRAAAQPPVMTWAECPPPVRRSAVPPPPTTRSAESHVELDGRQARPRANPHPMTGSRSVKGTGNCATSHNVARSRQADKPTSRRPPSDSPGAPEAENQRS